MSVELRLLKDAVTGQPFVPVTHWDAVSNKPNIDGSLNSINASLNALNTSVKALDTSIKALDTSIQALDASIKNINIPIKSITGETGLTEYANSSFVAVSTSQPDLNGNVLIDASVKVVTLSDASDGHDGLASALDIYNNLANTEKVIATIISKLNYTVGLDSSANLVWSEESGLTENTIKEAIEDIAESIQDVTDEKVKVNSTTVDALFPLMAISIDNPSDGSTYSAIYDSGMVINASLHSAAIGYENNVSGKYSIAEGYHSEVSGDYSYAEGLYTLVVNNFEHAEGSYNISHTEKTIHSIGGGNSLNRKNIVEILNDGSLYIIGVGNYTGKSLHNSSTLQDIILSYYETLKNSDNVISNILVNHQYEIDEQKYNILSIDTALSNITVSHENDIQSLDEITSNVLINHEDRILTIYNDDIVLANILVNYENRIKELENKIKILENKNI